MEITPTRGPSCEAVRDPVVELLSAHPVLSAAGPIRADSTPTADRWHRT